MNNENDKIDINDDDLKTYDRLKNTFDSEYLSNASMTVSNDMSMGFLVQPPKNIWRIMPFGKDSNIVMDVPYKLNIWKRFWFKFFLGFHIERIN